ncbi:LysR family transcriptional regulator [Glacieibacterium frigidum]|uniref:LysR family transcriptional regulator n=1 Tax=Glacieibacterium frigidum TaxID=2593303 RepID=A0A552UJR9_9SPHN|nr:LysR family transcriptional regulator [Glacieibacterium frigidum]
MFDWGDLRYFLAVAQTGSTLAAGRMLRVSQTTAARRVAALEADLGVTLFEKRPAGYRLTPIGEALVARARGVEAAAAAVTDAAAGAARDVSGTVRVTTSEIIAATILAPMLRELHDAYPAIRIELDTSAALRDLAGGAADVAVRSVGGLSGTGVVGRRVADDMWTVYCSRDYAAQYGLPTSVEDLRGHSLVGGGGEGVWFYYLAWLRQHGLEGAVATEYDSALGLLAAVRAGLGPAVLPSIVADADPSLVCCLPMVNKAGRGIWLLTHERVRHTPRVRVVIDFLAVRLTALARAKPVAPAAPRP